MQTVHHEKVKSSPLTSCGPQLKRVPCTVHVRALRAILQSHLQKVDLKVAQSGRGERCSGAHLLQQYLLEIIEGNKMRHGTCISSCFHKDPGHHAKLRTASRRLRILRRQDERLQTSAFTQNCCRDHTTTKENYPIALANTCTLQAKRSNVRGT